MSNGSDFIYTGSDLLFANERSLNNYNRWIVSQFVRYLPSGKAPSVLDFGAGIGTLSVIFEQQTAIRPAVLEVDAHQRAVLQERGFFAHSSIDEIKGKFDLIYTSNVLEHIENDVEALTLLRPLLSEYGRIVIFVPAFKAIWTSMDDKVGHHRRYSKKMLRDHLQSAGYDVERIVYRDSVGFMLALLFKLIGSKSGEPSGWSLAIFDKILLPVSRLLDIVASPFFGKNVFAAAKSHAAVLPSRPVETEVGVK